MDTLSAPDTVSHTGSFRVRGFPLFDSSGTLFLGESITFISPRRSKSTYDAANTTPGMPQVPMSGGSPIFLALKAKLLKAAQTQVPILLFGETGTGKELAASFIHQNSPNIKHDLVILDCTILGEHLFESELFGHEKGAFTGATTSKKGLFELADNGTLFLDEIGDLPLSQQPKLLRALENGQFRRVGGTAQLSAKVRIVCATHKDLMEMVRNGQFREDLFYRLSVFQVSMPSLRERMHDIPHLCSQMLAHFGQLNDCTYTITKQAIAKLLSHTWPGNIRELKNCLHLASSLSTNFRIEAHDINLVRRRTTTNTPVNVDEQISHSEPCQENSRATTDYEEIPLSLDQIEASYIEDLFIRHNNDRKLIAAEMGISERTLYRKLTRLNIGNTGARP